MVNGSLNTISNYVLTKGVNLQNYRNYTFHIDHINQKTNENYLNNLEIVTVQSNMMNKNSKGYTIYKRKNKIVYMVQYGQNWKYFDLYIGYLKNPLFNTEEEAINEVEHRRKIIDKYRFKVKTLEELNNVIDFAEKNNIEDINYAYIKWKGIDI